MLVAATLLGLALNLLGFDPLRALDWAASINGVAAAPVMALMTLLATRRDVMGRFTLPRACGSWASSRRR